MKTKRLFFVFADKHAHAWRKPIEMSRIDLSTGDHALAAILADAINAGAERMAESSRGVTIHQMC